MENLFREVHTRLYLSLDSTVNFPAHIHDDLELVYVIRGSGHAFCDGTQYTLSPGDFFVVFPEQVHSYSGFPDGDYILLVINPSRLLYADTLLRSRIPEAAACHAPELAQLLLAALAEHRSGSDRRIIDGYITVLLGKLMAQIPTSKRTLPGDSLSKILLFCNQHCQDTIGIEDICRALGLSRSHVSHLFNQRLKLSFPEYINALRLNRAINLLKQGDKNITQVAELAGFPTARTFNRVFRRQFGCSPTEYRKTRQKKD